MLLLGSLVNGLGIVIGTMCGLVLHKIPEKMKETVMSGMALCIIVLGVQMAFKTENSLILIISVCLGGMLGELLHLEEGINRFGTWLERRFTKETESNLGQGFVTATLIFITGAMGIVGALDSGIRGNHQVQYTKAVMDGFMSLLLSTTLGWGVLLSAIPVLLYQGAITLFAKQINEVIPKELMTSLITELTAIGGIMIMAIGLNIIGLTTIRVANLVPAILVVCAICFGLHYF